MLRFLRRRPGDGTRTLSGLHHVPDGRSEVVWLTGSSETGILLTGIDPPGFPSRVRILHAMYEDPSDSSEVSFHQVRQESIAAGLVQPETIGDVNLDDETVSSGIPKGLIDMPASWLRLRWADLEGRLNLQLDPTAVAPEEGFHRAFPRWSWPARIQPPPEGSLDLQSFRSLAHILEQFTTTDCLCYWWQFVLPNGFDSVDYDHPPLFRGPLARVVRASLSGDLLGTPQNWWPVDRSWCVYSDWDLSTTTVAGSQALTDAIEADDNLETFPPAPQPPEVCA